MKYNLCLIYETTANMPDNAWMGAYMKKKLMIMGVCIIVLLLFFAGNLFKRLSGRDTSDGSVILRDGDMITVNETFDLLKFLGIDTNGISEILGLPKEYSENKSKLKEVNTEDNIKYLKFGQCLSLLKLAASELGLETDAIIHNLSFDLKSGPTNKAVLTVEFLNLYECILAELPEGTSPISEKKLFILGNPNNPSLSEGGEDKNTMVTDQGNYSYLSGKNYEEFYEDGDLKIETADKTKSSQENSNKKRKEKSSGELFADNVFQLENYIDYSVTALVSGSNLVYIKEVLEEETLLSNVWIAQGKGDSVSVFLHNTYKDFSTKSPLSKEVTGCIGDLTMKDGKIVKISIKPDKIEGKVLVANKDFIEVQGYGKLPLHKNYKIYKIYDELSMELTNSILVGYEAIDFIVAKGEIVAALITEPIKAQNIRVLLKTNKFSSIFHDEIVLSGTRDFTVTIGEKEVSYKAGSELTFKKDDEVLKNNRIFIQPKSENGKIQLLSLERSGGKPAYRGSIEISAREEGMVVVNELPLEEYLYAVLPSEMPTNYGLEALKVQAICARSYAYNQLLANSYGQYGAHVDDSISYQVYNNIPENDNTILAVKDTYGKVIEYGGSVITAYYFSTSSGHTASIEEVWGSEKSEYLVGKIQNKYDVKDGKVITASTVKENEPDFSTEETFRNFILDPKEATYDSEFPWYRWKTTISLSNLQKSIEKSLESRYKANPDLIQTLTDKDGGKEVFESIPVSTIGELKDIKVYKREKSGILSEILLLGSKATLKVSTEYNIRTLLAPLYDEIIRQDDSTTSGLTMLPSAFFVMDKDGQEITFYGGGYGHGVGMSQNGVKAMADAGISYEEILKHYYTGVGLGFIY